MIYVMSDIHGCYKKYREILKKIEFNDLDTMFVLGDVVDRGGESIKVLQDMMMRSNVFPIMGNHEYMAHHCVKGLFNEITEETIERFDANMITSMQTWLENGGDKTLGELKTCTKEDIADILDYMEEFSLCEEVDVNGNHFILVHAGLNNFSPKRKLEDYRIHEVCFEINDYDRQYFGGNTYIVTGHTPTFLIKEESRGKIYHNKNNIAIDCGAVFDEKLACLCLDTMKEYYV